LLCIDKTPLNMTVGKDKPRALQIDTMETTSVGEVLDNPHDIGHPAGHTIAGEWADIN